MTAQKRKIVLYTFDCSGCGYCTEVCGSGVLKLADDSSSPEMEYLRALVWEEVEKALGELPAAQRDVFCLTKMEGFTFRELAEDTGIPVATLLSRKHYAVKYLRSRLAEIYEAFLTD